MKTDEQTMREIRRLLDAYIQVCNDNLGTPVSRDTYIRSAKMFVRWTATMISYQGIGCAR